MLSVRTIAAGLLALPSLVYASAPTMGDSGALPFFVYGHNALMRTRLDPIINPSAISGHTHVFAGSNRITAEANFASITDEAACTTAPMTIDKSVYWAPQLYYKHEDGKFSAITGEGVITYWFYHKGEGDAESYPTLPDDFRIVAGNMTRNSIDLKRAADQAVSYQCFGPGYDNILHYIPADFECETIRPQISFPNCWDGVNSYKADGSHVAYGEGHYEVGKCPEGFVRIPTLFLETYYKVAKSVGESYNWRPGSLVFAHGDNFGLTFHADWMNGFPSGALNIAYDECKLIFNGSISSCPYFQKHEQHGQDCTATGHIINQSVGQEAPLDHLPGNNVEFNSSALGNLPKVVDASYHETSKIVKIDPQDGGICKNNHECTDWHGQGDEEEIVLSPPNHSSGPGASVSSNGVAAAASQTGGASKPPGNTQSTSSGGIAGPTGVGSGNNTLSPAIPSATGAGGDCGETKYATITQTVYVTGSPPRSTGAANAADSSSVIPAPPQAAVTSSTTVVPVKVSSTSLPVAPIPTSQIAAVATSESTSAKASESTRLVNAVPTLSVSSIAPAPPQASAASSRAMLAGGSSGTEAGLLSTSCASSSGTGSTTSGSKDTTSLINAVSTLLSVSSTARPASTSSGTVVPGSDCLRRRNGKRMIPCQSDDFVGALPEETVT